MLCPLSYAPSRRDIRGERLTLLTAVVRVGRWRGVGSIRIGARSPTRPLGERRAPLEAPSRGPSDAPAVGASVLGRPIGAVGRSASGLAPGSEPADGPADPQQVEAKRRELERRIEAYESGRDELVDRLADAETTGDRFWTVAVVDAAAESIVVVATEVSSQFEVDREGPVLLDRLLSAIRRGVDVSVLLSPAMFEDALTAIDEDRAVLAMAQGAFTLRVTDDVYGNFYLIDGEEVCLEVSDPLAPDRLFGMLDLRDRGFATRVSDGFTDAWEAADVVEDI